MKAMLLLLQAAPVGEGYGGFMVLIFIAIIIVVIIVAQRNNKRRKEKLSPNPELLYKESRPKTHGMFFKVLAIILIIVSVAWLIDATMTSTGLYGEQLDQTNSLLKALLFSVYSFMSYSIYRYMNHEK
ncbi:MAG: hypothetical protein LUC91_06205 [Prevotella sp.]|nr:hypothetical protein [Prevotella sp.]